MYTSQIDPTVHAVLGFDEYSNLTITQGHVYYDLSNSSDGFSGWCPRPCKDCQVADMCTANVDTVSISFFQKYFPEYPELQI